ncbi:MAG TPA: hypothetical protein VK074_04695 [Fodinibius sp.]|nr:hypothetical protein [Fodinibius sp.]
MKKFQLLFLPTNQGFDYYFGLPFSNDMGSNARPAKGPYDPLPIMRNEEIIERGPDQALLTKRYTEETVQFIEENKAPGAGYHELAGQNTEEYYE